MSSPLKAIRATFFEAFVIELGENHTPMDLINRGAARGGELVHLVAYRQLGSMIVACTAAAA
jgi:hypothetical protein